MELKVKIYDCSLLFRKFLVPSISLIQSFQQTSDTCTIQGRPKLCSVVFKERVWLKDMVGTSLVPGGQILCHAMKAKDFPCGATARRLWTSMVLEKEIMVNSGPPPKSVPHSLTFLAASIQAFFFLKIMVKYLGVFVSRWKLMLH